ncbi:hypothetical protein E2562_011143 [Oryza meyeriana var. granulata]|uniref:Uncharacterized protein n=1 Tax=Oryza meyeriana var. granulata TaxID=110450 RepID=A0A6G1DG77_9ORYZ|nr:hypothetical protein E2562_011143 [Oryza meyeriana var. granulata]
MELLYHGKVRFFRCRPNKQLAVTVELLTLELGSFSAAKTRKVASCYYLPRQDNVGIDDDGAHMNA